MQKKWTFIWVGSAVGLLVGYAGWWLLGHLFVASEKEGTEAIAQVRFATGTSLAETQAAVSDAHFLVEAAGIDPTAFYKFRAPDAFMDAFIRRAQLQAQSMEACESATQYGLRRSWWRPTDYPASQCYVGRYDGDLYYLIYDAASDLVFLKIQDT